MTSIRIAPIHPDGPPEDIVTKMMRNTERRAGKKWVRGNVAENCTKREKILDMLSASKGASVIGKACTESEQYVQAALLRKMADHGNTRGEEDSHVWNSNGVLNRLDREDFVRTHCTHFSAEAGSSHRNRFAHALSRVAHCFHGVCEMFAAPTGMTTNFFKNVMFTKVDDQSPKNRAAMATLLFPIGAGTTALTSVGAGKVVQALGLLGWTLGTLLVAFPVISCIAGASATAFAWISQLVLERQTLTNTQKSLLLSGLNSNLERMVTLLLKVKGNNELTRMLGLAMQGKAQFSKFDKDEFWDRPGIPKILAIALNSVDQNKSLQENMACLQEHLGTYLTVKKLPAKDRNLLSRYTYACDVTDRESHYVALASVVDHIDVDNPHSKDLMDLRKQLEEIGAPLLHDKFLKGLAIPASGIDRLFGTKIAATLNKWADPEFRKRQDEKLNNPSLAWRNHTKIEYIYKNKHQYGSFTKKLVALGEIVRRVNMDIVLSSNGQLSRMFGNLCFLIHRGVGSSPPSRSISYSLGRFFGGALLAGLTAVIALSIASTPTDSGASFDFEVAGSTQPFTINFLNIGIIMFTLALPTLMVQEIVRLSVFFDNWKGNISKPLAPIHQRTTW